MNIQEQLDRIESKLDLLLANEGKEGSREYSDQEMAEAIAYSKETGEVWPDWYADLYSIPGFKKPLDECQAWLDKNGITEARANETAAALKGGWNGKKYKDPWATLRAWVKRPALGGSQRQLPTVGETLDARQEQERAKFLADYEKRWSPDSPWFQADGARQAAIEPKQALKDAEERPR